MYLDELAQLKSKSRSEVTECSSLVSQHQLAILCLRLSVFDQLVVLVLYIWSNSRQLCHTLCVAIM